MNNKEMNKIKLELDLLDTLYACVLLKVYTKREPCKFCGKLATCTQTYRSWDCIPMCVDKITNECTRCCQYKEKPNIEYHGVVLKLNIINYGVVYHKERYSIQLDFDKTMVSDYHTIEYFKNKIKKKEFFVTYEEAYINLTKWAAERSLEVNMYKITDVSSKFKSINKYSFLKSVQNHTNFIYFKDDLPKDILNNAIVFDKY